MYVEPTVNAAYMEASCGSYLNSNETMNTALKWLNHAVVKQIKTQIICQ